MPEAIAGPQVTALELPGGASQPTSYFAAPGPKAVLFAPGMMFHHDSWHHLAQPLQAKGIAGYCLEDSSSQAVQAGLEFLREKGHGPVSLAGGSAGGAAVLKALQHIEPGAVDKVLVLAPAGGTAASSPKMRKLFVITEEDRLGLTPRCRELYEASAQPKALKTYGGTAHAQHMFNQPYGEELRRLVLDFLSK